MNITPRNAADLVMANEKLYSVEELHAVIAEGKTLKAVMAEPFLWRNLSKKAFEILTPELCAKIEKDHGINITRLKKSGPASVMNCDVRFGDTRSMEDCIVAGTKSYLFFTLARNATQMKTTWFNC